MKVKPWGKEQGDFVIIDEENFDEDFHKKFTPAELEKLEKAEAAKAAKADAAEEPAADSEAGAADA
jgi:hypothetical protein